MKNILFIINTEGQLLTTSSLILETYNEKNDYFPYIIQLGKTGNSRFKESINTKFLSSFYIELDINNTSNLKLDLDYILKINFERVFIFLEQHPLNVYFSHYFKKRGSIICLAPDGNKPYFSVDRFAIKSRLFETVKTYTFLNKNGFPFFKPYFLSWNYGNLGTIDEIWLTFPNKFVHKTSKKIVSFSIIKNRMMLEKINEIFDFNPQNNFSELENIIFYTNNVLYRTETYEAEIESIKFLLKKFEDKKFYLKYHPSTPKYQIDNFKKLGIKIFSNSIPAELYIAQLKNSIIVGCWSNALMINNTACKFYWIHNYLIKIGKMPIDLVNIINPSEHIKDVYDLNQIKF